MARNVWLGITLGVGLPAFVLLMQHPEVQSGQPKPGPTAKDVQVVVDKAVGYLKESQQADGGFSPKFAGPGITALVTASLIRNGVGPQEPVVAKGLKYLESKVRDDGGIYDKFLANYTTAVAIMALKEGNQDGKYSAAIKKAVTASSSAKVAKPCGVNRLENTLWKREMVSREPSCTNPNPRI